jgi:glyoxylase-like metal-dependent hydrolase (beta-lactamase superfamily II)
MNLEQIKVGFMDVFCYVIACPKTKEALVIDPAGDEDSLVNHIREKGLNLKYIVNTHGHGDHTCGNQRAKDVTNAKILMHPLDDELFNSPQGREMAKQWGFRPSPPADQHVKDGDTIRIGEVALQVLHTPGHSPGGICLYHPGHVFTGDTLFVGAIGRTDLPGASESQFLRSIKEKLLILPDETIVWPGHDYGLRPSSTIAAERSMNPWLQ